MTTPDVLPSHVPGKVKLAIGGLWLHATFLAFGVFVMLADAQSKSAHGQDGAGPLLAGAMMVALLVALIALAAVQVTRGLPWARLLAIVLESFFLFCGLISLIGGLLLAPDLLGGAITLANVVVISVIMWLLLNGESRAWFEARIL